MSGKTHRFRQAAAWSAAVLIAIGGIISAVAGSWLVVALAVVMLAVDTALLMGSRQTPADR